MTERRMRNLTVRLAGWFLGLMILLTGLPTLAQSSTPNSDDAVQTADEDDEEEKKKKRRRRRRKKRKEKEEAERKAKEEAERKAKEEAELAAQEAEDAKEKDKEEAKEEDKKAARTEKKKSKKKRRRARNRTWDTRLEFAVFSRDGEGRVSGGLAVGWNFHPAVVLDLGLHYGDGRFEEFEWLSTAISLRTRPLMFFADGDSNIGGNLVLQTGWEFFMGQEFGDANMLDLFLGVEYRTPAGANFLLLGGPGFLFMDNDDDEFEFRHVVAEAQIGFGYSF